jgi:hypothetical protein
VLFLEYFDKISLVQPTTNVVATNGCFSMDAKKSGKVLHSIVSKPRLIAFPRPDRGLRAAQFSRHREDSFRGREANVPILILMPMGRSVNPRPIRADSLSR